MDKKSKFKKVLAAASTLAVVVGASNAMGNQHKTNNVGLAEIGDGQAVVNAVQHAGGAGPGWVANDSFYFAHARDLNLGLGGGAGATVGTIDLNAINGRTITVVKNSSVGSIINSQNANVANLIINDGRTLTLTTQAGLNAAQGAQAGGVYTGVGTIVLGSGAGGAILTIDTNATFGAATTINSDAADDGVINVAANRTVTFGGILSN